jgi:hypothetical protein
VCGWQAQVLYDAVVGYRSENTLPLTLLGYLRASKPEIKHAQVLIHDSLARSLLIHSLFESPILEERWRRGASEGRTQARKLDYDTMDGLFLH